MHCDLDIMESCSTALYAGEGCFAMLLKSLSSMKNCKRVVSLRISANAELYTTLKCLSQQMSALELLQVRYLHILLVYPCTLYYEMLTR